jgi:hypothetical protein
MSEIGDTGVAEGDVRASSVTPVLGGGPLLNINYRL